MNKDAEVQNPSEKAGFTLVEIMLVLALTSLLVVGMIAGTFSSIAAQRYNDTARSFAEYLRTMYSEVISPETLGFGNSKDYAILGKVLIFGGEPNSNRIYSATITGSTSTDGSTNGSFMSEFANASPTLYCGGTKNGIESPSTVAGYTPLWEASLMNVDDVTVKFIYNGNHEISKDLNSSDKFSGTLVIARTPTSSAVHTVWLEQTYDIANDCESTSRQFNTDIICSAYTITDINNPDISCDISRDYGYNMNDNIGFCIKGDNVRQMREVRITADGRNTSAVTILNTDVTDENIDKDGGGNRCKW